MKFRLSEWFSSDDINNNNIEEFLQNLFDRCDVLPFDGVQPTSVAFDGLVTKH